VFVFDPTRGPVLMIVEEERTLRAWSEPLITFLASYGITLGWRGLKRGGAAALPSPFGALVYVTGRKRPDFDAYEARAKEEGVPFTELTARSLPRLKIDLIEFLGAHGFQT
jgi:hypothetical protein